jgi:hypothetical protein
MLSVWRDDERCVESSPTAVRRRRAPRFFHRRAAALWERTTNPAGAVGEGMTAAYRALRPRRPRVRAVPSDDTRRFVALLSEALRGEGAVPRRPGNRFTDEPAPRVASPARSQRAVRCSSTSARSTAVAFHR